MNHFNYKYRNQTIRFIKSDRVIFVNADDMAKVYDFKMYPNAFLKLPDTRVFIKAMESSNCTWESENQFYFHKYLALKYALELQAQLNIWLHDTLHRIENLNY